MLRFSDFQISGMQRNNKREKKMKQIARPISKLKAGPNGHGGRGGGVDRSSVINDGGAVCVAPYLF